MSFVNLRPTYDEWMNDGNSLNSIMTLDSISLLHKWEERNLIQLKGCELIHSFLLPFSVFYSFEN